MVRKKAADTAQSSHPAEKPESSQAEASQNVPHPASAAKTTTVEAAPAQVVEPGDLVNRLAEPYTILAAAKRAQELAGAGEVVKVQGGWVVRGLAAPEPDAFNAQDLYSAARPAGTAAELWQAERAGHLAVEAAQTARLARVEAGQALARDSYFPIGSGSPPASLRAQLRVAGDGIGAGSAVAVEASTVKMYYQLNRELGQTVLFGQRRISEKFATIGSDAPDYIRGRSIYDVARDLRSGTLTSDDIRIYAFMKGENLVTLNNRGLAALSLADLKPTNVVIVKPSSKELNRFREVPIPPVTKIPGPTIVVTPGSNIATVTRVIQIPTW